MNPADAEKLGLKDGDMVKVSTEAGSVEVELEVTEQTCKQVCYDTARFRT